MECFFIVLSAFPACPAARLGCSHLWLQDPLFLVPFSLFKYTDFIFLVENEN